jgi:DivIVA domain-containing protein
VSGELGLAACAGVVLVICLFLLIRGRGSDEDDETVEPAVDDRPAEALRRGRVHTFETLAARTQEITFRRPRLGRQGYEEDQVDAFLDEVIRACTEGRAVDPARVRGVSFRKPGIGRRGYDEDEVDVYLDEVEEAMRHLGGDFAE